MITHDNIVTFLKNNLTTYLKSPFDEETGEPLGEYSDFADNMEIYQESSYNSNKDIVITVQFLKGSTQLGVTDIPINVIFEVIEGKATNNKTIANEFMDLINSFIEDYNDKTTLMVDDNNVSYIVKQYYSSTNAIGNGQQRGTNKYKAFTMDMRLIIYENGYFQSLEDSKLKFNFDGGNIQVLENVLEITTHISHGQEGFTLGSNPNQKLRINSIQYQLQVTYIATCKNKDVVSEQNMQTLHQKIAAEALQNITYNITHEGLVTRTANMKVIDYVESTPYADVMKVQLTLARE
jgi:hypothetical protein